MNRFEAKRKQNKAKTLKDVKLIVIQSAILDYLILKPPNSKNWIVQKQMPKKTKIWSYQKLNTYFNATFKHQAYEIRKQYVYIFEL